MSFRLFIYYCAACGGWAALIAWLIAYASGIVTLAEAGHAPEEVKRLVISSSRQTGAILGLLLGGILGTLDACFNDRGARRVARVVICLVVGWLGGFCFAWLGEALYMRASLSIYRVLGWVFVGVSIGTSLGLFDLSWSLGFGQSPRMAIRKIINGAIGGALGGLLGGVMFGFLEQATREGVLPLSRSALPIGLVILGICIGLLIGLAQVILKEAWVRVEIARRPGKDLILSKEETTIGREESCDIGLFGEQGVEKVHARIIRESGRYLLTDAGTPGGTYLNDRRVGSPTPLCSGDAIRVGTAVLRFGERQKHGDERDATPRRAGRS